MIIFLHKSVFRIQIFVLFYFWRSVGHANIFLLNSELSESNKNAYNDAWRPSSQFHFINVIFIIRKTDIIPCDIIIIIFSN